MNKLEQENDDLYDELQDKKVDYRDERNKRFELELEVELLNDQSVVQTFKNMIDKVWKRKS